MSQEMIVIVEEIFNCAINKSSVEVGLAKIMTVPKVYVIPDYMSTVMLNCLV